MKKVDVHIYIVLAICLVGFVIGSFFDYSISFGLNRDIFRATDTFGLFMSVIGTIPGYGVIAFLGGGFFVLGLTKQYKTVYKVILMVLGVVCLAIAIFFSGREFFGPNGFYFIGVKEFWGYFIAAPFDVGFAALGFFASKKSTSKNLWALYALLSIVILLTLVGGTTLLKAIFHRPRFRAIYVYEPDGLHFHNWWEACSNYKTYIKELGIIEEDFKSFPSGHASCSAVFMMSTLFLPLINEKYKKFYIPLFYVGLVWTLLISFVRIYVGAHFLSDVSMGVLLAIIFFFIGRIVVGEKINLFTSPNEEEPQEQNA